MGQPRDGLAAAGGCWAPRAGTGGSRGKNGSWFLAFAALFSLGRKHRTAVAVNKPAHIANLPQKTELLMARHVLDNSYPLRKHLYIPGESRRCLEAPRSVLETLILLKSCFSGPQGKVKPALGCLLVAAVAKNVNSRWAGSHSYCSPCHSDELPASQRLKVT